MQPCVRHTASLVPTHKYLDFDAGRDFEREIVVKVNAPGGRAGRAAQAVVEGRARRDGDEHRSVPVGRVALQAHAGDLGGVSRRAQPVLDPHEVAAAAARHRDPQGDRGGDGHPREPLDPDARREGVARDRAAHAAPASAARGGRRAQPRGDPDGGAHRAAHARHQRRARAGRAAARRGRRGRRDRASAGSRCTCAATCASSSSTGCARTGRTSSSATSGSTRAARTPRPRSAGGWRSCCVATGSRRRRAFARRNASPAASRSRRRCAARQTTLF